MIVVTGAFGFIGSKFIKYLNRVGRTDIIAVDYLTNGHQYRNLTEATYDGGVASPLRLLDFLKEQTAKPDIEMIYHFGAVSDTTCWDGELMLSRNTEYTIDLIALCSHHKIPISYSSSASVYGNGTGPLNLYAYSKWLVDQYVQKKNSPATIQGFRYFNVYSNDDAEWHKGNQASPYYKFKQQALNTGSIEIFEGSDNFKRDFIHVDTLCDIQYQMSINGNSGIYDLGSGEQKSFLEVAEIVSQEYDARIVEIPFPDNLKGCYQTNTIADMRYLVDQKLS